MISHSATAVFTAKELAALKYAERIVACLPDEDANGDVLRCHEVARVVSHFLGLPVMDGYYGPERGQMTGVEHSWLYFRPLTDEGDEAIGLNFLDPYCIGRLPQVQLVHTHWNLPHQDIYKPGYPREDVRDAVVAALIQHVIENEKERPSD